MADRPAAAGFEITDPNLTWEQAYRKYIKDDNGRNRTSAEIYSEIIKAAQRSRPSVNDELGLPTPGG